MSNSEKIPTLDSLRISERDLSLFFVYLCAVPTGTVVRFPCGTLRKVSDTVLHLGCDREEIVKTIDDLYN